MGDLVTEAKVEVYSCGAWARYGRSAVGVSVGDHGGAPLPETMLIPQAVTEALAAVRYEREREAFPDATPASPIRVVDSSGTVVAQWGKP